MSRTIASVDVGKVNMGICVVEVSACLDTDADLYRFATGRGKNRVEHRLASSDFAGNTIAQLREQDQSSSSVSHLVGAALPTVDVLRAEAPFYFEWEDVWYAVRILRWGVYSLRATEEEAAREDAEGVRAKQPLRKDKKNTVHESEMENENGDTLESLVPKLLRRASNWLRAWHDMGVTDVCIEQQVAMGGNQAAGAAAGMAGNVAAKVLSHVLQALAVQYARQHATEHAWAEDRVIFMSPRLTNLLADHLRGEKRPSKGVPTRHKKKFAVAAVEALLAAHHPTLECVFARARANKRDDLADSLLQALRFARDSDGLPMKKRAKDAIRLFKSAKQTTTRKRKRSDSKESGVSDSDSENDVARHRASKTDNVETMVVSGPPSPVRRSS